MALKHNNTDNQASKFSSLLAGAKVEPKKPLNEFLEGKTEDRDNQQNIKENNNEPENQQPGKLNEQKTEQNIKPDVVKAPVGEKADKNMSSAANKTIVAPEPEPQTEDQRKNAIGAGEGPKVGITDRPETKTKKDKIKIDSKDFDRFLKKSRGEKTKSIFINEDFDSLIGKIVNQIGEPGLTKTGYLENILIWHFETFGEEIKTRRRAALQQQNNDL